MSAFKTYQLILLPVLIAGVGSSFRSEKAGDKKKPIPTPEQAVKQFNDAVKAGNVDAALAALTKKSRKLFDEQVASINRSQSLYKVVEDALNEKFGKEPGAKPESGGDIKAQLMSTWFSKYWRIEILGKEIKNAEKVNLKVRLTSRPEGEQEVRTTLEDKITVVKEGGAWKLLLPDVVNLIKMGKVARKESPDPDVILTQLKALNVRFAKQVREGKYATREQASLAYGAALYRTMGDVLRESEPREKRDE